MQTDHAIRNSVRSALFGLLLAAPLALPVRAAVVDLATKPLFNGSTVKPNLLFILDESSSMDYNYLPDEVPRGGGPGDIDPPANPNPLTDTHALALTSSQCNGVAYDPTFPYELKLPVDSDGNALTPATTYGAALINGFAANSATINLANTSTAQSYYVYVGDTATGIKQKALSYTYTSLGVVDGSTTFYRECNGEFPSRFQKTFVTAGEQQRYASWYSYYRTRLLMMKTLAGQSFQPVTSQFRVGFLGAHDKRAMATATFLPINDFIRGDDPDTGNPLQKKSFYNTLYGIGTSAGDPQKYTPLRGALSFAGQYFGGKLYTGGTTAADKLRDPMQYSCQQNFAVMASDGYWNSSDDCCFPSPTAATNYGPFQLDNVTAVGDQDGGATAPMKDASASGSPSPNTLADIAMYYYMNQSNLRKPPTGANTCTSGATGANLCPTSPNVPGNGSDNNQSPHMTTFTLGLGINGLLGYSPSYKDDLTGDFALIKTGDKQWPNPRTSATVTPALFYDDTLRRQVIARVDDLWHAAVNGRGSYLNANNPRTLDTGLKALLAGIATRVGYGAAGATSSLAPTATDNALYVASFVTGQWTGNLVAESIDPNTGQVNNAPKWCVENVAKDPLNGIPTDCTGTLTPVGASSDSRKIYYNSTGGVNPSVESLVCGANDCAGLSRTIGSGTVASYFDNSRLNQWYSRFTTSDKDTATPRTLVEYLRGQTQYMSVGATPGLYRERKATLGDIVDTQPVFVGAPYFAYIDSGYAAFRTAKQGRGQSVFAGANDAMVHAFNAADGIERWAFVPTPAIPNMYWLADDAYGTNHHYYVNGRLASFDVCAKSDCTTATKDDWRTILIGGLGGGGRGFFALDVTDPATTTPKLLWEFTSLENSDLGYSFGNPVAVKKKEGHKWVVLVSSGYDNVKLNNGDPLDTGGSGRGFLFVLDPFTGATLDTFDTGEGSTETPSGLGRIAVWTDSPDQDVTALYAYGGDLLGNFFRFDINCTMTDDSAGKCKRVLRLATLKDDAGNRQPITTRPEMTKVGGNRMIFVATGKYLEQTDLDSTKFKTQSLYAIVDNGTTVSNPRDSTKFRKRELEPAAPNRTIKPDPTNTVDPAAGWFVDFPDSGERSNVDMVLARGTLLVPTNVPTSDQVCYGGGYSWLNYFDYASGGAVAGTNFVAVQAGNDLITGINMVWINGVPGVIITSTDNRPRRIDAIPFPGPAGGALKGHRVGWREIISK